MPFRPILVAAAVVAAAPLAQAQETSGLDGPRQLFTGRPYSPYADRAFPSEVFFGDTHVHTGLSPDAGGSGTRLMPDDAYRLARGEQIVSNTGQPVKLSRPLDFYMITDHSDAMGAILDIINGAPNIMADPDGRQFHEDFNAGGQTAAQAMFRLIQQFAQGEISEAINYQPGNPAYARVWDQIIASAERYNEPGRFTTFIAFEWTSLVTGDNLHRNVIFRDGRDRASQVLPYTTTPPVGSRNPRDLWAYMAAYEDKTGGDVIAIPHNGNLSNGRMFAMEDTFSGEPYDAEYARLRQKWEPLYEVSQYKGDGETHPLLSPEDEFADFETWDFGNLDASVAKTDAMFPGEYARSGLRRGLQLEAELGVNPFKFGLEAATDTHTGFTTIDEDNFFSKFTTYEPGPERAVHTSKPNEASGVKPPDGWQYAAEGLTAVWATENTREAIFDAMERRETYATTGPRMRVRFFGGWGFDEADGRGRDLAVTGYQKGVPMGQDMLPRPDGAASPSFLVYALRDPIGANLDRIQIIKGWLDAGGETHEKVYDVAWSDGREPDADGKLPPVGDTVDLSIPSWTNTIGAPELVTVWTDPDFDPTERAFYYARVIEIPTPRWTAYDQARYGLDLPDDIPLTTQDRAYTSPIWYTPAQ